MLGESVLFRRRASPNTPSLDAEHAELYEKVWPRPMRILAREYGISDVGLAKVCKDGPPISRAGILGEKSCRVVVPNEPSMRPIGLTLP